MKGSFTMKKFKSILTLCMALAMLLSCIPAVYAAEVPEATINMDANCSLTIWKYDWTNAVKDGVCASKRYRALVACWPPT